MNLSIGIIGLPNVGKSTLFNALLKRQAALAANYPFATIEPNIGIVDVPDVRLGQLAQLVKAEFSPAKLASMAQAGREVPERIMPAVVKFYDIAGLVKGASTGEGLGNQFLTHIRETDALVQVVRNFSDENVIRAGATDPSSDVSTINTELILSDLQMLEKRLEKLDYDAKKSKTKESIQKFELAKRVQEHLNGGKLASELTLSSEERLMLSDLNLLTIKPMIYVLNVDEDHFVGDSLNTNVNHAGLGGYGDVLELCAKVEADLCSFSDEEKAAYMKELGITESGLDKLIKKGFDLLNLQTYLTAGPKEVRAWTIHKGDKAPQAAGVIHSDFERGFISAEIISCADLVNVGGWKLAKDKGLIRIEGKNYVMQDGDVVEFRFNV